MPFTYSEADKAAIIEKIIDDVSEGKPVKKAAKKAGVSARQFNRWVAEDSQTAQLYDLARQEFAQTVADDLLALADEKLGEAATNVDVNHVKLRIDTRKWIVAKLLPRYSDRMQVEVSGGLDLAGTTDEELNAQLAQMLTLLSEIAAGNADSGSDS